MSLRVAMLAPIAWRTPPRHYGPWERVVSLLTEGLVARGVDVTLFATADSLTSARLAWVCPRPYEEAPDIVPKAWECLHVARVLERAGEFDLIHNHFDFLPLTYSGFVDTPMVTTIHGFSSAGILPVYRAYNGRTTYVSISDADRCPELDYVATVHHGIDLAAFTPRLVADDYLLFFGRFHPDKGAHDAVEIARRSGMRLRMAGIVQDRAYWERFVAPHIDGDRVTYEGSVGPCERDRLLGGARALLHPIHFDEPFGLSVVEAMACGTPVIAYARGSMPEIVWPGVNGFLVGDVDDAVRAVARLDEVSRAQCRFMAESRFSVEQMVDRYLRVYERMFELSLAAGPCVRMSKRAPRDEAPAP